MKKSNKISRPKSAHKKLVKTFRVFRDPSGKFTKAPIKATGKTIKEINREIRAISKDAAKGAKQDRKILVQTFKVFRDAAGKFLKSAPVKAKKPSVTKQKKQAKKAPLKQALKKPVFTEAQKKQTSYTLRRAPLALGDTTVEKLRSLEANYEEFDKLKKDDEYWVFTYAGGKSRTVHQSLFTALLKLQNYGLTREVGEDDGEHGQMLLDSIKIMKFKKSPSDWQDLLMEEKARKQRKKEANRKKLAKEAGIRYTKSMSNQTIIDALANKTRKKR